MIHTHSLGRAVRYYPERTAFASGEECSTFRELHDRVGRIAAGLTKRGFRKGDRLALLLPNEREYVELVYACAWLGVIAVPLNTRLSAKEIDHVLVDAAPHGLVRHSSLAAPSVELRHLVIAKQPLDLGNDSFPPDVYDPDAVIPRI